MSESKQTQTKGLKLYEVGVAVAEKYDDEGKELVEQFRIAVPVHFETKTPSEVLPVNIIRRPDVAEVIAGVPAERLRIVVREVSLQSPFPVA